MKHNPVDTMTGQDSSVVQGQVDVEMLMSLPRRFDRLISSTLSTFPGGSRGFEVTRAAERFPHLNQREVGHRLGLTPTVVTYVVDRLVEHRLVARVVDTSDRRVRHIRVTDAGRRQLASAGLAVTTLVERALLTTTDLEIGVLRALSEVPT